MIQVRANRRRRADDAAECARCGTRLPAGSDGACWHCAAPLCPGCWKAHGHCGDPLAERAFVAVSMVNPNPAVVSLIVLTAAGARRN